MSKTKELQKLMKGKKHNIDSNSGRPSCKFCNSTDLRKQGFKKIYGVSVQWYLCKSCGRKFRGYIEQEVIEKFEISCEIRRVIEKLIKNYLKQNDLYTKFFELTKKYYGKDAEWFDSFIYEECDFCDYFNDLNNLEKNNQWDDFKQWMWKFEKIRKEAENES
jgi:hypothetical protein